MSFKVQLSIRIWSSFIDNIYSVSSMVKRTTATAAVAVAPTTTAPEPTSVYLCVVKLFYCINWYQCTGGRGPYGNSMSSISRQFIVMTSSNGNISALLAICAGNSPSQLISPYYGQQRGALMFSSTCSWINGWVNNRGAGDLRRHRADYDVTVNVYKPIVSQF